MRIFNFQFKPSGDLPRAKTIFKSKKGFTMIELLVAMTLFSFLMAVAAGGFVKAMRTQRAIVALMAVNDNASLTLEQMAREMRTGYHFKMISDTEIQFVSGYNELVSYRLNEDGAIERGITGASLVTDYEKITADNVKVTNLRFELRGASYGDGMQPRITIAISVTSPNSFLGNVSTNIQTTVSSRILER